MGWQDRDYSRNYRGGGGPLWWLLTGSVPLFTVFGIHVQMHALLLVTIILGLTLGIGPGFGVPDKLASMVALFVIVLLHEFGHCFACRWVGGTAEEIVMHPLGGLALCQPPSRPMPSFITSAGGPAVNVIICILTGIPLLMHTGHLPPNPFTYHPIPLFGYSDGTEIALRYFYWLYMMSYSLLMFNLLPIYPLDGGQMLQAALWPKLGFYQSMKLTCEIGMFACVAGAAFALSALDLGLALLAGFGFYACFTMRQQLLREGAEGMDAVSYAIPKVPNVERKKKQSWWARRRAEKAQRDEINEQREIDRILAKVGESGMNSLTGAEKRALARASEHQRKRDAARRR